MKGMFKGSILLAFILVLTLGLSGCSNSDSKKSDTNNSKSKVAATFGDDYEAMIKSGEKEKYKDYDKLFREVRRIQKESGATYTYILSPKVKGEPSLEKNAGDVDQYMITLDGSEVPEEWGTAYDWEVQFQEAWEGTPASARSGWTDLAENTKVCWSGFAPIYNSNGDIVALLGIDYPADEITKFPEWNREASQWNEAEDSLDGLTVPEEVKTIRSKVTSIVDKYAQELSK